MYRVLYYIVAVKMTSMNTNNFSQLSKIQLRVDIDVIIMCCNFAIYQSDCFIHVLKIKLKKLFNSIL